MGKSSTPTLLVCAAIAGALAPLRGIAPVVWPAETGSPTIGIALAGSGALFVLVSFFVGGSASARPLLASAGAVGRRTT
jgi:hypothetical protein